MFIIFDIINGTCRCWDEWCSKLLRWMPAVKLNERLKVKKKKKWTNAPFSSAINKCGWFIYACCLSALQPQTYATGCKLRALHRLSNVSHGEQVIGTVNTSVILKATEQCVHIALIHGTIYLTSIRYIFLPGERLKRDMAKMQTYLRP